MVNFRFVCLFVCLFVIVFFSFCVSSFACLVSFLVFNLSQVDLLPESVVKKTAEGEETNLDVAKLKSWLIFITFALILSRFTSIIGLAI